MKKIYYYKLIRDKIPAKMAKKGVAYAVRRLGPATYEKELLKKVGEEASGLLAAKSKTELISELADVIDVIDEIKRLKKIKKSQIVAAQKTNAKIKGGFKKRLLLLWNSDNDGYQSNERRYRHN